MITTPLPPYTEQPTSPHYTLTYCLQVPLLKYLGCHFRLIVMHCALWLSLGILHVHTSCIVHGPIVLDINAPCVYLLIHLFVPVCFVLRQCTKLRVSWFSTPPLPPPPPQTALYIYISYFKPYLAIYLQWIWFYMASLLRRAPKQENTTVECLIMHSPRWKLTVSLPKQSLLCIQSHFA